MNTLPVPNLHKLVFYIELSHSYQRYFVMYICGRHMQRWKIIQLVLIRSDYLRLVQVLCTVTNS